MTHDAPSDPTVDSEGYFLFSRRPLQVLVFLAPLIVFYEIGLAVALRSETGVLTTVEAHHAILRLFSMLGMPDSGGLFLGGIVILTVLFVWHLLNRDPWRISLTTAAGMAVESILLTLPLLVIGYVVTQFSEPLLAPAGMSHLGLGGRMAISVGAGLYEELLFRMVLIAVIHTIVVDMAKGSEMLGALLAIGISAIAFTLYHPLTDAATGEVVGSRVAFYLLAGIYFGVVFLVRGFGIVVAVHAIYDILMVWMDTEAAGVPAG